MSNVLRDSVPVIAVGRRRDRLEEIADQSGRLSAVPFDVANISRTCIIKSHPDLDAIFLNVGVHYVMDFSKPHTVDISKIQNEVTVNYVAVVALTHVFMPFFQAKSTSQEVTFILHKRSPTARYPIYD